MSTNNFWIENRCVVVEDEDYESGNMPKLGDYLGNDRNFQGHELLTGYKEQDKLMYTTITIRAGYYSGACIDFEQDEDKAYEYENDKYIGRPKDEQLKKRVEKILERERKIANKILDKLIKDYGYVEIKKIGQFSNGEAVYKRV